MYHHHRNALGLVKPVHSQDFNDDRAADDSHRNTADLPLSPHEGSGYNYSIFSHHDDLKRLYIDGIVARALCKTYHGALLAFLADSLAAHLLGGFKGCMSYAHRICRTFMITKEAADMI